MRRSMSRIGTAMAALLWLGTALAADTFVPGIDDLPLMPGLVAEEDALVFDKPDGRIVQAVAHGGPDARAIRDFYDATLPQLGWRRVAAGRYAREGEALDLQLEGGAGRTTVHFTLSPGKP
jgi:hypothetical protein